MRKWPRCIARKGPVMARGPAEFQGWPVALTVPFGPYRGIVRYIVDGDTFDVFVDIGWNEYRYTTVRLAGVNAPESNRAATKEAGLAAKAYVLDVMPPGTRVKLYTRPDPDSFGRYIADAILEDGRSLATMLVDSGNAVYKTY